MPAALLRQARGDARARSRPSAIARQPQIDLFAGARRPSGAGARRPQRRGESALERRGRRARPRYAHAPRGARRALPPEGLAPRHLMTYCVGVKLDAGLVFLSDSRTNAGLDQISTFRKMMVYERPGDRFMVMLSAGNLSISQQVREILQIEELDDGDGPPITIWNATSMFDAARVLGARGAPRLRPGRRVAEEVGPRLQRLDDLRRPDRRRGDAPVPGLLGRQLHRGDARDLLLPDRRVEVRQARARPHDAAVDAARRSRQVRAGVDGLDAEVEPVGRPAARPGGLRGEPLRDRRRSSASTTATRTSR